MKISDLLKQSFVNDSKMNEVLKAHPKQIINYALNIPVWKIHYSYTTVRGNTKEVDKYLFRDEADWDLLELDFKEYIENENDKHPERKLSNVEILDTTFMGKILLELD